MCLTEGCIMCVAFVAVSPVFYKQRCFVAFCSQPHCLWGGSKGKQTWHYTSHITHCMVEKLTALGSAA